MSQGAAPARRSSCITGAISTVGVKIDPTRISLLSAAGYNVILIWRPSDKIGAPMSSVDPIISAAHAGSMTDTELLAIVHEIKAEQPVSDFQQAVLDEAQMRGILSDTDVMAISRDAPLPLKFSFR